MASDYRKQWKDPRWQRKRLEIFSRDNFTCKNCSNTDAELNAHHLYYIKGAKPWEYKNSALVTLCSSCHDEWHRLKSMLDKKTGFLTAELEWIGKCIDRGPHRSISDRFESDIKVTLRMLSSLKSEAMQRNDRYSSQVVDCCTVIEELILPNNKVVRVGDDQDKKLEQVSIIQGSEAALDKVP